MTIQINTEVEIKKGQEFLTKRNGLIFEDHPLRCYGGHKGKISKIIRDATNCWDIQSVYSVLLNNGIKVQLEEKYLRIQ